MFKKASPAALGAFALFFSFCAFTRSCLTEYTIRNETSFRSAIVRELTEFVSAQGLCVGVQTEENAPVDERVLALRPGALLVLSVGGADNRLNLVTVDETSDIRVADLSGR